MRDKFEPRYTGSDNGGGVCVCVGGGGWRDLYWKEREENKNKRKKEIRVLMTCLHFETRRS